MKKTWIQDHKTLLQTIILMVVLYAWLALAAALLGIFYSPAIFTAWIILCAMLFYKKILRFSRLSREMTLYIFIALAFTLCVALVTVPTIFAGRDQGSLATAAMQLADHHRLVSYSPESAMFFTVYGPGKALNFPGFHYLPDGGLLTQFPLPYIAFLGGFYGIAGIPGFVIANGVLLFIFIVCMAYIARTFLSRRTTLIFLLIFLSSFVVGWFGKFTLSENIASMLLWSAIALLLTLRAQQHRVTYYTFILTISLLLFTRIEGIWFFFILFYLASRTQDFRSFLQHNLWQRIYLPAAILCAFAIIIFIMNQPFLVTMAHALMDSASTTAPATTTLHEKYSYLFYLYGMYGLLTPLLFAFGTIIVSVRYRKYRPIMWIALIVAPLFLYYFYPQISSDHPWMLRRFVFALVPATILISVWGIAQISTDKLYKKMLAIALFGILFATNVPAFVTFFLYAENASLLSQTRLIADLFGPNDLVLIDKNAAGNGWSMITTPLRSVENKHAVYFFNPYDMAKIDRSHFERTFLIVPDSNADRYRDVLGDTMHRVTRYYLAVNQLDIASHKNLPQTFPAKNVTIIRGTIFEIK